MQQRDRSTPSAGAPAAAWALQVYYLANYTSTYRAIPLSVALATAWAAGHRRWPLLVAAWFVASPLGYALSPLSADTRTPLTLLGDAMSNGAMLAAVLVLGEAVRSRRALQLEQERSERLLLNVLPAPIAARLKAGEGVIADAFPEVTVLFADLVDFTRRSQRIGPAQVVATLNELFSAFDRLAQRHGLEKIKTIGDAYMVAGGLPQPRPDHAQAVAELALAMLEEVAARSDPSGQPLAVRMGIDTGPVEAGVIGTAKFSYDLWGDTVNTASRMESTGSAGCIQVTGLHLPAAAGRLPVPAAGTHSGAWARWSPGSWSEGTGDQPGHRPSAEPRPHQATEQAAQSTNRRAGTPKGAARGVRGVPVATGLASP